MYNYIVLSEEQFTKFLKHFGKQLLESNDFITDYFNDTFHIKPFVRESYQFLLKNDSEIKEKYDEIQKNNTNYGETFFAFNLGSKLAKNLGSGNGLKNILDNNEINDANLNAYREAINTLINNINNNYIRHQRKFDRNYLLEPTPLSFYEYKGYNDNRPVD